MSLTPPQRLIDGLTREELLSIVLDPETVAAEAEQRKQESANICHVTLP